MESKKQTKEEWLLQKGVRCLYKACVFHNDNCGPYKRAKPVTDGVFGVNDLNEDTKLHFKFLKLKVDEVKIFSKQQLSENRSGLILCEVTKICAHYPYTLRTGYKHVIIHITHINQNKFKQDQQELHLFQ